MAEPELKRPSCTWSDILDAAPDFVGLLWGWVDAEDLAVLPPRNRAAAYFDMFSGEVENGGVSQYFFNQAFGLPDFDAAPDIVAADPALADIVPVMREAHQRWAAIAAEVAGARAAADAASAAGDPDGFIEAACDLFERHRDEADDFDHRCLSVINRSRLAAGRAFLEDTALYLDIAPVEGLSGHGVEHAVLDSAKGPWRARFVDGFPIGPNYLDAPEAVSPALVRFSADRMHLDVDRYMPHTQRLTTEWIDYRTGASSTRRFANGVLMSQSSERHGARHGVSEFYAPSGDAVSTEVYWEGEPVAAPDAPNA